MVLEMQAAKLERNANVTPVKTEVKVKSDMIQEVDVPAKQEIKTDALKARTYRVDDEIKKYETKVSTLQEASKAYAKDKEILTKMKEIVETSDFENMTREEKVDTMETLIKYVDDINKVSLNTKFENRPLLDGSYVDSDNDNNSKVELERVDSQTLGLSVDNISKVSLDQVRVAGESYMPPYSFDVTDTAGASTALSVIGSAISKIETFQRDAMIKIESLTKYPECLELDRSEYSARQADIRNAESARRLVARIQNSIRAQITKAQSQDLAAARSEVERLIQ